MRVVDIHVLLHCHVGEALELNTPAISDALHVLNSNGLINNGMDVTPKGLAYVEMLKATPMPIQIWEDPREAA